MKKSNCMITSVCVLAFGLLSSTTAFVHADTNINDPSRNTQIVSASALGINLSGKNNIFEETLNQIQTRIGQDQGWISSINHYIAYSSENSTMSDAEFNHGLLDLVNASSESNKILESLPSNQIPDVRSVADHAAWQAGILACDALGYPLSAKLMRHAVGSNPNDLNFEDTYGVFKVNELLREAGNRFEMGEVAGNQPATYTTTFGFTFTSENSGEDYVMALHAASITLQWLRHSDGTYGCLAYLHDRFDFKKADNSLTLLGIANTIAVNCTNDGYISPFSLTINGTM